MTDPTILDMLTAARALHERADYAQDSCETCSTNDRYVKWPCDTAKALGATGRSEWFTPGTIILCGAIRTEGDDACFESFEKYPCRLAAGHSGTHMDQDGDRW